MKKLFCLCLTFLLFNNLISAQAEDVPVRNKLNLHVEASTWILLNTISANLEVNLYTSESESTRLYGRVGYGSVHIETLFFCDGSSASGGFLGVTMLTGKGNNHLELFGGAFIGSFENKDDTGILGQCDEDGSKVLPTVDVGYRYQKPEGGVIFRAKIGILGIGVGLGYAF